MTSSLNSRHDSLDPKGLSVGYFHPTGVDPPVKGRVVGREPDDGS